MLADHPHAGRHRRPWRRCRRSPGGHAGRMADGQGRLRGDGHGPRLLRHTCRRDRRRRTVHFRPTDRPAGRGHPGSVAMDIPEDVQRRRLLRRPQPRAGPRRPGRAATPPAARPPTRSWPRSSTGSATCCSNWVRGGASGCCSRCPTVSSSWPPGTPRRRSARSPPRCTRSCSPRTTATSSTTPARGRRSRTRSRSTRCARPASRTGRCWWSAAVDLRDNEHDFAALVAEAPRHARHRADHP